VDVETLRRALLEHGLHEAASLVDADIEQQQVEDDRERDEDEGHPRQLRADARA